MNKKLLHYKCDFACCTWAAVHTAAVAVASAAAALKAAAQLVVEFISVLQHQLLDIRVVVVADFKADHFPHQVDHRCQCRLVAQALPFQELEQRHVAAVKI